MTPNDYSRLVKQDPQAAPQDTPFQQRSHHQLVGNGEQRGKLAQTLGTAAEAARALDISRAIAHQIVDEAYQQTW